MLKLKLKNPAPDAAPSEAPAAAPRPPTAAAPKLNLKLKSFAAPPASAADGQPADLPKQKRKYTKKAKVDDNGQPIATSKGAPKPKKRAREENGEDGSPAPKRKPKPTAKSLAVVQDDDDNDDDATVELARVRPPRPAPAQQLPMKISFKAKNAPALQRTTTTTTTTHIKLKGAGKPPPRPPGVGYDSEAEEAEIDPAIESQFILRMVPGDDCDMLRKAIEEKTIGKGALSGGPRIIFRFFDREGRRAMITIQGRLYAAAMVELPCIVESMKSWNKKDWVKTADVCQMLLVLGQVNSEEEAKKFPLPREIQHGTHQYPHGLTPPMQWARKRRFRPRTSYQRFEEVEDECNAQLAEDQKVLEGGGRVSYDIIDADHSDPPDAYTDEDGEGEDDDMYDVPEFGEGETPAADAMDAGDLEQMLAAGLMEEDEVELEVEADGEADAEGDVDDLFGDNMPEVEVELPATSHDVAMHALGENSILSVETAASTPNAETESPDDDDDNDDDAESEEDDEVDEEAAAKQQQIEDIKAEIRELDQNIENFVQQRDTSKNVIFKQRVQAKIDKQMSDKDVNLGKLAALGVAID